MTHSSWIVFAVSTVLAGMAVSPFHGKALRTSAAPDDVKAIFQAHCVSCHSGAFPAGSLDLSGDLAGIAATKAVVRGRPHSSALYKAVADGSMPKGGPKLSDLDIAAIQNWIIGLRPDPRALFATRCVGCHGAANPAAGLDLSGGLDALAKLSQANFSDEGATSSVLYKRLADGSMPKNGTKFTEDELALVRDWLNTVHPNPHALFRAKCVSCHGSSSPAAGLDLSASLDVLAGQKVVLKGKPAESALYKSVATGYMPKGGQHLTDRELALVWYWVASLPKE